MPTRYILGFEEGFAPDDPEPCPENAESRVRNPDTNLVREPLSKPVKEEEYAAAREADFDRFFAELLTALGFAANANATLPAWWQGWPARTHIRRWVDDIGLSRKRIIEVALETRDDHPRAASSGWPRSRHAGRSCPRAEQRRGTGGQGLHPGRCRSASGRRRGSVEPGRLGGGDGGQRRITRPHASLLAVRLR